MVNIPMPSLPGDALLKGIDTGSGMFSRLMQPILHREQQKQAEEHFKQQMALRRAQFERSGANSDIQRQLLEQQLQHLKNSNDPMYEFNQYKALENMITGVGQSLPQQGAQQQPIPSQEMGEGMGVFSPEGFSQAQQMQQPTHPLGELNLDTFKQHPMLRAFAKKHLGFDPLAVPPQTPGDKQAAALNLFQQKEKIKAQNKGGDIPTNAVLTQNQQAIQGIDTVLPMLDELINDPSKLYGRFDFSPSKKAAYNAKTSGMIDTLVAAQSLPKVQASIDLVEQQIRRATNEGDTDYIARLKDLRKDLVNRRGKAQSVLKSRKVNTGNLEDFSHLSDDELRKIAGGG